MNSHYHLDFDALSIYCCFVNNDFSRQVMLIMTQLVDALQVLHVEEGFAQLDISIENTCLFDADTTAWVRYKF